MQSAVVVGEVAGGHATNPLLVSYVDNPELKEALVESLRVAGLLANGRARYSLKVILLSLHQPTIGVDMTVTAIVHYEITDTSTGAMVWQEDVATPYTATFGDAVIGATRLRLASEGAVRMNLARLVERLNAFHRLGAVSVI